jgi:hypothetical protein
MGEKMYNVTLDTSRCLSYTVNGIKYEGNRSRLVPESRIKNFELAGVFVISEKSDEKAAPALPKKPRAAARETNAEDKGETVVEGKVKPSGFISANETKG